MEAISLLPENAQLEMRQLIAFLLTAVNSRAQGVPSAFISSSQAGGASSPAGKGNETKLNVTRKGNVLSSMLMEAVGSAGNDEKVALKLGGQDRFKGIQFSSALCTLSMDSGVIRKTMIPP